eukprot:6283904-Amphidinium_carterae.1
MSTVTSYGARIGCKQALACPRPGPACISVFLGPVGGGACMLRMRPVRPQAPCPCFSHSALRASRQWGLTVAKLCVSCRNHRESLGLRSDSQDT